VIENLDKYKKIKLAQGCDITVQGPWTCFKNTLNNNDVFCNVAEIDVTTASDDIVYRQAAKNKTTTTITETIFVPRCSKLN
jgi:hypothetical protein